VRELPSGTVTFLFSDVEGSTRLLREYGERYTEVLSEHRVVLRDAFARHGGVEVDTQGDAFGFTVGRWWAIAVVVVVVAVVWTTLIPENRLICSVLRAQYRP
jgi:class 3 adenylate cyclase